MRRLFLNGLIFGSLLVTITASQQNSTNSGFIEVPDGKLYYETNRKQEWVIVIRASLLRCY